MPEDVNYVETEYGAIPTMLLLSVDLSVQLSPKTVRKGFDIGKFAQGNTLGGGFI